MKKYLIIQTRNDAIGTINKYLVENLNEFKTVTIDWSYKNMLINHFKELLWSIKFALILKDDDIILSTNSKSVHTHILPMLSKCKKFMIHYHFDKNKILIHKIPGWDYNYLFKHWHTIFAAKSIQTEAKKRYSCNNSNVVYCGHNHMRWKK
jgi:hypothetical protein